MNIFVVAAAEAAMEVEAAAIEVGKEAEAARVASMEATAAEEWQLRQLILRQGDIVTDKLSIIETL